MNFINIIHNLSIFVLFFPIIMGTFWALGGIIHFFIHPKNKPENYQCIPEQKFTIIVPVFNEQEAIKKHIIKLLNLDYSNYELWVIDDCSTDDSYNEIMTIKDSRLKLYQNDSNLGKAHTLNNYLDLITTDYFLVIDSDTIVDPLILTILNQEINFDLNSDKNIYAGYTGNISVHGNKKNRSLILQKIEYRTFVDMIKRTHSLLFNSVMTLSGACSCYKTNIVQKIGKFNITNSTEDIEISWRLNQAGYNLKYLGHLQAKVLTPENIYALIEQRKRWTVGLLQTIAQNFTKLFSFKNIRLKFFVLETFISSLWAISFFIVSIFHLYDVFTQRFLATRLSDFLPSIGFALIFSLFLASSAYIIADEREKFKVFLYHYLWFPLVYFLIQPFAFIKGLKEYLFTKQDGRWRKTSNTHSKYFLATIIDILATFIVINFLRHGLSDDYVFLSNYSLIRQIIVFEVLKITYLILYYFYFKFGEKLVDQQYPKFLNVSLYLVLFSFFVDAISIISYLQGSLNSNNVFIINDLKLIVYLLFTTILYNTFKLFIIKKKINP